MKKIKERSEREKTDLGRFERQADIRENLAQALDRKCLDEEDGETILRWATSLVKPDKLIHLLEKIKFERLSA